MNIREYNRRIAIWRIHYKIPVPPSLPHTSFDLTKVNARRTCVKCKNSYSWHVVSRHHIENDFRFACMLPDAFAPRYIQFLDEDVVLLCNRCHTKVHRYYAKLNDEMHADKVMTFGWYEKPTVEFCLDWKAKYRKAFERWIKQPPRPRKRKPRISVKKVVAKSATDKPAKIKKKGK